ncbi:MAG: heme lyase CcmF/NrfE family subunit [Anaerolineales bacterium]|nr:heme lyase CcmF/NrfE family subunit [Anaerolineales bacterium]
MLADVGLVSLFLSFLVAIYATFISFQGGRRNTDTFIASGRNGAILTFPLLTISVTALVINLIKMDFSLAYVSDVTSRAMSPFLRVTALWGGQAGSILFWAWLMAGYVAAVTIRKWQRNRELMPYVVAVAMGTTAFFIGLSLFVSNPFTRLWHVPGAQELTPAVFKLAGAMAYVPQDGQGLNPLLRHFGMIGHPPTTYLGFTGFVIPFAFAMAALITGKANEDAWIRTTRRWTLVAWLFLSVGLVLGGRWAYDVLGWGGFWGWDPVENAMLMPWLTGTAFLHSVMIQEKRGMLKVWNIVLIILTYALMLFGTFITRTGVISSVHSFAKSALGPAFFTFIGFTFIGSMSLLFKHLGTLKSEHEVESFYSREALFLLQNVLFVAIAFAVFWGTVFPMISELITGTKITVGPPFFKRVTGPMFSVLVLLMAITPFFAWRKQSGKRTARTLLPPLLLSVIVTLFWSYFHRHHPSSYIALWIVSFVALSILLEFTRGVRARMRTQGETPLHALLRLMGRNRRRYGGYLVHLSVIMIGLGFIGDAFFKYETQGTLAIGEQLELGGYELEFNGLEQFPGSDGREVVEATTTLFKDGRPIRELNPRRDYFVVQRQPVTVPAVHSTMSEDVYVLLVGWEEIGLSASTFKIYVNPLVNWTWFGGVVLVVGALIAAWPNGGLLGSRSYSLKPRKLAPRPAVGD